MAGDTLNARLTEELNRVEPITGGDYVEANFLVPLYKKASIPLASVLADWLLDHGHEELAEQVYACISPEGVRACWQEIYRKEMVDSSLTVLYQGVGYASRLEVARGMACYKVLKLFPGFMRRQIMDSVNNFTRTLMRRDGFLRRIMPPIDLSADEMEQAPDTDGPYKVMDRT